MTQHLEEIKKEFYKEFNREGFCNYKKTDFRLNSVKASELWSWIESKLQQSDKGEGEWREKVRQDYKGILSNEQIEATIEYWENIISSSVSKALEKRNKEVEEAIGEDEPTGYKNGEEVKLDFDTEENTKKNLIFVQTNGKNLLRHELKQKLLSHLTPIKSLKKK